jgi:hypothetical protein
MWPTKSSLHHDKTAPAHIALGRGPKRKLFTHTIEGIEVVTTLSEEDLDRLLPSPGRRLAWARTVESLTRNPLRIERAEVAV